MLSTVKKGGTCNCAGRPWTWITTLSRRFSSCHVAMKSLLTNRLLCGNLAFIRQPIFSHKQLCLRFWFFWVCAYSWKAACNPKLRLVLQAEADSRWKQSNAFTLRNCDPPPNCQLKSWLLLHTQQITALWHSKHNICKEQSKSLPNPALPTYLSLNWYWVILPEDWQYNPEGKCTETPCWRAHKPLFKSHSKQSILF